MNKGHDVLGTLINANLLKVGVVREMALWIASSLGKQKGNFVVQARVGLLKIPKLKDWGAVRRIVINGKPD